MQNINELLPESIINKYYILQREGYFTINEPVYVNINGDFEIREFDSCYTIMSSKVIITMWKEGVNNLHISIL